MEAFQIIPLFLLKLTLWGLSWKAGRSLELWECEEKKYPSVSDVHSLSNPSPSLALSPPTAETALGALMGGGGEWEKALLPLSTSGREVNMLKWTLGQRLSFRIPAVRSHLCFPTVRSLPKPSASYADPAVETKSRGNLRTNCRRRGQKQRLVVYLTYVFNISDNQVISKLLWGAASSLAFKIKGSV